MDKERFASACTEIIGSERQRNGIGTLGEKTLHAVLKLYYEPHKENHEIRVGSFVADIVGENGIIEIQTRQFNKLLRKLECFLEYADVTVVYPVIRIKYLSWINMVTGEVSPKRRSPKRGTIYDAIPELYKIKYTLDNPRMNLCICIMDAEETRYLNGWSKDGKKGSSRCDRIPVELVDEVCFSSPCDYAAFIPQGLPEEYTSADFASAAKISRGHAGTVLNLLSYLGQVEKCGKTGRSILYKTVLKGLDNNEFI